MNLSLLSTYLKTHFLHLTWHHRWSTKLLWQVEFSFYVFFQMHVLICQFFCALFLLVKDCQMANFLSNISELIKHFYLYLLFFSRICINFVLFVEWKCKEVSFFSNLSRKELTCFLACWMKTQSIRSNLSFFQIHKE